MTIQHIELRGERYVILPEREFLELQQRVSTSPAAPDAVTESSKPRFREITPLPVGGPPASEMRIQDRR